MHVSQSNDIRMSWGGSVPQYFLMLPKRFQDAVNSGLDSFPLQCNSLISLFTYPKGQMPCCNSLTQRCFTFAPWSLWSPAQNQSHNQLSKVTHGKRLETNKQKNGNNDNKITTSSWESSDYFQIMIKYLNKHRLESKLLIFLKIKCFSLFSLLIYCFPLKFQSPLEGLPG